MAEINPESAQYNATTQAVLTTLLADVTALRTAFNTAITKLNADGGVTDTNYAAAAALTTTLPQ